MDTKELEFFKKQIHSNVERASTGAVVLMGFLDEAKQTIINNLHIDYIDINFDGGFDGSEYKRAIFKPIGYESDFRIVVYEIEYNQRYLVLNHRKILGTLMALGIKREAIGDIVVDDYKKAYFACTEEISSYIEANLKVISNVPIELKKIAFRPQVNKTFIDKEFILSSLRLDCVIAGAYKLSRAEAQEIIKDGLVNVNHLPCLNLNYQVKEEDILSIKHKGRVYIRKIGGLTRSERIVVTLGFLK